MLKINKFLLIFCTATIALFILSGSFIQSDQFSKILSPYLSAYIKKKYSIDVRFKRIEFTLQSADFVDLELKTPIFKMTAEKFSLTFTLQNFLKNKLNIDKITAQNALVVLSTSKGKNASPFSLKDLQIHRGKIFEQLPFKIDRIIFKNTHVKHADLKMDVKQLILQFQNHSFSIDFSLRHILYKKDLLARRADGFFIFDEKQIVISQFNFYHDKIHGSVKGLYKGKKLKGIIQYSGKLQKYQKYLPPYLKEYFNFKVDMTLTYAFTEFKNPHFHIKLFKPRTKYFNCDLLIFSGKFRKDKIIVSSALAKKNERTITLLEEVELYDRNDHIVHSTIKLLLENVSLRDSFYFFKDKFSQMEGTMNGSLEIFQKDDRTIIKISDNFSIDNFSLGKRGSLLKNKGMKMTTSTVMISKEGELDLSLNIDLGTSKIQCNGLVLQDGMDLNIVAKIIDLAEFGPISTAYMKGVGRLSMNVSGTYEDTIFKFIADIDRFHLFNMNFKRIVGHFNYHFSDLTLRLKDLRGDIGDTSTYRLYGDVSFLKNLIDLNVKLEESSVKDFFSFFPRWKMRKEYLNYQNLIKFSHSGSFKITGGLSENALIFSGEVHGKKLSIARESFSNIKMNFSIKNKKIKIFDGHFEKRTGSIAYDLIYHLDTNYFRYNVQVKKINIQDFKFLRLDARKILEGSLRGQGTGFQDWNHQNLITLKNFQKEEDFFLSITGEKELIKIQLDGLDKSIRITSLLNFKDMSDVKKSFIEAHFDIKNIPHLLNFSSKTSNLPLPKMKKFKSSLNVQFAINHWRNADIDYHIPSLEWNYYDHLYKIDPWKNYISIRSGKIINWNINLSSRNNFLTSKGTGDFNKKFQILNNLKLDSRLLYLLTPHLSKAQGTFTAEGKIDEKNIVHSIHIHDNFYKISKINGTFSKVNMELLLKNTNLSIEKSHMIFNRGEVEILGNALLKFPHIAVDLEATLKNISLPFFEKSQIFFDGQLNLRGDRSPYEGGGKILVKELYVHDKFSKIFRQQQSDKSYEVYKPNRKSTYKNYIVNNIDITFKQPIKIENEMLSLQVVGDLKIRGDLRSPLFSGNFTFVPKKSKFIFKGLNFILKTGELSLKNNIPKYNVSSEALLDDYTLKLNVSNREKKLLINLSSKPFLSKKNIFSLLTKGDSFNYSRYLVKERSNVSSSSLAQFILDQLPLNKKLKNTLGLKVSISSDAPKDEEFSPVTRTSTLGTKVKIEKTIFRNIDIALSKTIVRDKEKVQNINIKYKINKNIFLEGVHEMTSLQRKGYSPHSLGFDLKYKKSF